MLGSPLFFKTGPGLSELLGGSNPSNGSTVRPLDWIIGRVWIIEKGIMVCLSIVNIIGVYGFTVIP